MHRVSQPVQLGAGVQHTLDRRRAAGPGKEVLQPDPVDPQVEIADGRGAAGVAILNAELMHREGML